MIGMVCVRLLPATQKQATMGQSAVQTPNTHKSTVRSCQYLMAQEKMGFSSDN